MDDQDRTDAINEAMNDAITDGDGRPRRDALEHHLAARVVRCGVVSVAVRAVVAQGEE
jgi:hypothetical protein